MTDGTNVAGSFPIWANGAVHPAGTPVVDAEDQGFLLGLAVFDTVLYEEGCLYFVEEHLDRLRRGAAEIHVPWPPPWDPLEAMREAARALEGRPAALRMTLSAGVPGRGATLVVTPRELDPPPSEGIRVLVSSHRKLGTNQLETVKSTNRMRNILARDEARARGAWEAILPNDEGDLSEGTISNLFVVEGGALRTPPGERGCLSGIMREKVLEAFAQAPLTGGGGGGEDALGLAIERVEPEHVLRADEVFLTNTTGRLIPVREVLGLSRPVSGLPGPAGPVVGELARRVGRIEAAYRAAHPRV